MKIGAKKTKLPVKKSINLATVSAEKINWKIAIPAMILIFVAVTLFSKFAVIDRFMAVSEAQARVNAVQRKIDEGYEKIAGFGNITEIYAHYTYSDMTTDELSRVDRVEIIDLLSRIVLKKAIISSWTVSGNTLTVSASADRLQYINEIRDELLSDSGVEYCEINVASTRQNNGYGYETERVTAQITVHLLNSVRDEDDFLGKEASR